MKRRKQNLTVDGQDSCACLRIARKLTKGKKKGQTIKVGKGQQSYTRLVTPHAVCTMYTPRTYELYDLFPLYDLNLSGQMES